MASEIEATLHLMDDDKVKVSTHWERTVGAFDVLNIGGMKVFVGKDGLQRIAEVVNARLAEITALAAIAERVSA